MIVFISDLHLVDETTGRHNVPVRAFELFIEDLTWFVQRRRRIQDLRVVLLGDVFDLLRSEYWFGVDPAERPWALPAPDPAALQAHAGKILGDILRKNRGCLRILRAGLKDIADSSGARTEMVYVPGNHDRLVNLFGPLRARVRSALGLGRSQVRFENFFQDPDHGVLARHGHEYDEYNFGGAERLDAAAYDRVPIGDAITTELISRIPLAVVEEARAAVPDLSAPELANLQRNFQNIENVRPFSATVEWLLYQVQAYPALKEVLENAVDRVLQEFEGLAFIQDWYRRHDRWRDVWDRADKIQALIFLLKKFKVLPLGKLLRLYDRFQVKLSQGDDYIQGAAGLFSALGPEFRFVIMGHTHHPRQVPVCGGNGSGRREASQVYLNTGTWRQRYHRCLRGQGFMSWKDMTYVTIYQPGERANDQSMFDTWTGRLSSPRPLS